MRTLHRLKLWLAFAAIYVIWGSAFLAIRVLVEAFPPFLAMGLRSLVAGGILVGWASSQPDLRPGIRHWGLATVSGTLLFAGCHGLLAWSEQWVASGVAALILATIPLWLAVLDRVFGATRLSWATTCGLAAGMAGVGWITTAGGADAGSGHPPPIAFVALMVSAFCWAAGSLLARTWLRGLPLVRASGMQLVAGGTLLTVIAVASGEGDLLRPAAIGLRHVVAFAYLTLGASVVAFTAYSWLLRVSTPAAVGSYAFVNPVIALAAGWFIGGEPVTLELLMASGLVTLGVVLVVVGRNRQA